MQPKIREMIDIKSKQCCTPCEKSHMGLSNEIKPNSNLKKTPIPREYRLGDPAYIDPLYRPYHTDYSKSPYRRPYVPNTGYPLIDPYRRRMGWGQIFRSQHEGICPPGFRCAGRNLCIPLEPESWGMFYTNENTKPLLQYSNGKIPYNYSGTNPCKWKPGPWTKTICGGTDDQDDMDNIDVLARNGWDNDYRIRKADCESQYFW